jgi:hypothetical protein
MVCVLWPADIDGKGRKARLDIAGSDAFERLAGITASLLTPFRRISVEIQIIHIGPCIAPILNSWIHY